MGDARYSTKLGKWRPFVRGNACRKNRLKIIEYYLFDNHVVNLYAITHWRHSPAKKKFCRGCVNIEIITKTRSTHVFKKVDNHLAELVRNLTGRTTKSSKHIHINDKQYECYMFNNNCGAPKSVRLWYVSDIHLHLYLCKHPLWIWIRACGQQHCGHIPPFQVDVSLQSSWWITFPA